MSWELDDLPEYYRKQIAAKAHTAVPPPDPQPSTSDGTTAAHEGQEGHPRYRIQIHSKRRRLTDPDGVFAKWAIDGLVNSGIIPDDSAHWVQSVTFSQEQVSKDQAESTVITLVEVCDAA